MHTAPAQAAAPTQRVSCPKCSSVDTHIMRERNAFRELVFRCNTCGLYKYGMAAQTLFAAAVQEDIVEAREAKKVHDRAVRLARIEARTEAARRAAAAVTRARLARRTREILRQEEEERQAETRRHAEEHRQVLEERRRKHEALECAWGECDQPKRSNSIYCSRSCSNKNARFRYDQKKIRNLR